MPRWKRLVLVIGVCVLGLVAIGAGGLVVLNYFVVRGYGPHRARLASRELRRAAETWRGVHSGDACPTPPELRAERYIDAATSIVDEWGSPFTIVCTADETTVVSRGPDRREGTPDDIRVPEALAR
jgi:hypothetical protein